MITFTPAMRERNRIEVCFTPGEYAYFKGEYEIVVVIDVLRATSAICAAFDNGIKSIIPVPTVEEAWQYKKKGYLAGAERKGQIVEGFDFGNSPFSYMREDFKGQEVVLTTTNGTKSLDVAKDAEIVVVGSFLNLNYLCEWLVQQEKNILLVVDKEVAIQAWRDLRDDVVYMHCPLVKDDKHNSLASFSLVKWKNSYVRMNCT